MPFCAPLFRLTVTHRRMLEWVTFAQTAYRRHSGWRPLVFQLTGSFALVALVVAGIEWRAPESLGWPRPLALWGFSPLIARWASHASSARPHREVAPEDRDALRLAARRTWLYFEAFVTVEDTGCRRTISRRDPQLFVARRTSPTNIGVSSMRHPGGTGFRLDRGSRKLWSGWRIRLASMQKLSRYRGHFLNSV